MARLARALPRALRESTRHGVARVTRRARDHRLALDTADQVRDAVAPSLGEPGARERCRGRARRRRHDGDRRDRRGRGGRAMLRRRRRHRASTPRTAGYVEFGRPRAILVVDPIDGTRPAAAGLESCCVSVAVLPPSQRRDARRRRSSASCTRSSSGDAFFAARGEGAHASAADGSPMPLALLRQHRSRARCSGPPGCAAGRCCRCRSCSKT